MFFQVYFILVRIRCICCFYGSFILWLFFLLSLHLHLSSPLAIFIHFCTQFAKLKSFECNKMLFMCGASLICLGCYYLGCGFTFCKHSNNFIHDQHIINNNNNSSRGSKCTILGRFQWFVVFITNFYS